VVRAIDAQQVILQSNMAERVQQIQQQNPDMQQRYFALQLSEEDRLLREKVKQSEESEKTIIREKQEQKDSQKDKDKKDKNNAEMLAVNEEGEPAEEGGHINIKV
jgi:hypothetical protein